MDFERRFLCADGACIGVVGPAGYCRECGKPLAPADVERFGQLCGPLPEPLSGQSSREGIGHETKAQLSGGIVPTDAPPLREDPIHAAPARPGSLDGDGAWNEDGSAPELETRELCPDGTCIGVIGSDGRCRDCGATLASAERP
ncbi:MAG: hypothetical protein IPG96_14080 [Proteobacteria bacterium]|nr:hypothetical protein [Pseudomonadota bacterium]